MHPNRISLSFAFLLAALASTSVAHAACLPNNVNVPSTPTADFTLNGDGTVTHLKTGLMWKQCAEGLSGASCATGTASLLTLSQSRSAAATPFAGYSDWRLPNIKELQSIVEPSCDNPNINQTVFPNTPYMMPTWSNTSSQGGTLMWTFNFSQGTYVINGGKSGASTEYTRLVRGGQSFDSFAASSLLANQTITFGVAPTVIIGGTGTVSATATSGLAVSYTSTTTGICTVSGSTVTGVAAGTCTIAANQAGNGSFNAAPQMTQSFSVGLGNQAITFGVVPTVIVGGTGTVSATGGASGNAVSFTSSTPAICTISGSTVTGVAAGTCTIAANQAGNASYNAAPQVTQSFSVGLGNQTITFGVAPTLNNGGTGTVSATGGASGNAVSFTSSTPAICTISGSTVTGVAAGTCTIAANQAGNANYNAAPQVTQSFSVGSAGLANQTISFGAAPTVIAGGTGAVSATATSGLAVSYTSSTPSICTISGSTVTGVTAGTCTIAANQAGNGSFNAAPQVTQSFSVGSAVLANQTITFGSAPTLIVGGTGTVSATATSGLAVSYTSSTPGICTVSGSTVTVSTAGTCTIAANQAGNGSFNAAPTVTQSIAVGAPAAAVAPASAIPTLSERSMALLVGLLGLFGMGVVRQRAKTVR